MSGEDRALVRARGLFQVFAFLAAAATLLHQAQLGDWSPLSHHTLVSLSALWLLLRPSSLLRFALMSASQVIACALDMPEVVNHWLMLAWTNVTIGASLGLVMWRRRAWIDDSAEVYRWLAPLARTHLLIVYVFATLAKINHDFLDPGLSCAVSMYRDVPFLPRGAWTDAPAIWGTLFIEAGLAALLFFRRTRTMALVVGTLFHVLLAFAGHTPFSGFALALYALFLPDDFPDRLHRLRVGHAWIANLCARLGVVARSRVTFPALATAWLLAGCALTYGWIPATAARSLVSQGPLALFVCFAAVLTATMTVCLRQGRIAYAPGGFRLRHAVCAAGPVVLVLNGLSPYLGLKTQNSFAMYSNLQTEGDQWNHLLIPKAVRIFPLQDDLVGIVSSSEPRLNRWAQSGNRAVYFQFRNDVVEYPHASLTYELAGRRTAVAHVGDDPTLSRAPNRLLRKLLWFRPVPAAGRNSCLH